MAQQNKCLGVDIGATSVKIAEIVSDKAGVRITRLVKGDIGLPANAPFAERAAAVSATIRDLLKTNKFTSKQAVFCIPGQNVFIRRIRVPRTTDERLHLIVSYEAKQQIPFALDSALMEYQVIEVGDTGEVEVLLVAVKRDLVTEYMKLVDKTGLKPLMISVSSLALFNYHIFNSANLEALLDDVSPSRKKKSVLSSDSEGSEEAPAPAKKKGFSLNLLKGKGKKAAPEPVEIATEDDVLPEYDASIPDTYEEVKAYVNIGASTFDLAIGRLGERRLLGFTRTVAWAGNELSRMLQDKMGLTGMGQVEEIKRSRAAVIIPGMEDQIVADGYDPDVAEFVTTWADRLILDLRKSFDYYISLPDGMAVDSITLSGAQALVPNLPMYIDDKLGIPVNVYTELEGTNLRTPVVEGEAGITEYLIAMGLALTGVGMGRVSVDFLPNELKTLREFKKKNIPVGIMAAAIVAMLGLGMRVGEGRIGEMRSWLRANENQIAQYQASDAKLKGAEQARTLVAEQLNVIGDSVGDRAYWLEFLGVLEELKPPQVVVSKVSLMPDGEVILACEADSSFQGAGFFNEKLKEDPIAKEWIDSDSVRLSEVRDSAASVLQPGTMVKSFTIRMKALWKETRLVPARATLSPGLTAPTPTPVGTPEGGPGMFGPAMGPGGVPMI